MFKSFTVFLKVIPEGIVEKSLDVFLQKCLKKFLLGNRIIYIILGQGRKRQNLGKKELCLAMIYLDKLILGINIDCIPDTIPRGIPSVIP